MEADYLWGRKEKLYGWRSKTKNYSLILGAAIHVIDLVMWLLNSKPVSVFSTGNNIATNKKKFKKNSFEVMILDFPNDIKVKVTGNGACVYNHFHELKIFSENETISHTFNETKILKKSKNGINFLKLNGDYPDKKNRKKLIQNFMNCLINKGKKSPISQIELFDLMSVCFAAKKSSELREKLILST